MVSERKRALLKEVMGDIEKYPVVGIVDMHGLPARQLHQIKQQLLGKAVIRMVKKRVIKLALEGSKKKNIKELEGKIQNQPALLYSEANPFELANTIAKSVSKASAKAGDIAPADIVIPEGPTSLPPGPAIGDLQKARIQAGVEGDKIVVKKEAKVAKEGDVITKELANLLGMLGVEPMEISLNLLAVWDEGTVFGKDILFIPPEHYINQFKAAYSNAFNMALNIGHVTPDTLPLLLSKAHQQAMSLALGANIVTPETVGNLLAKGQAQAAALGGMVEYEARPAEPAAEAAPAEAPAEGGEAKEDAPAESGDDAKSEDKDEKTAAEEPAKEEDPAEEKKEEKDGKEEKEG